MWQESKRCMQVMSMRWSEKRIIVNNYKAWHEGLKQIIDVSNEEKAAMSEAERMAAESRSRAEVNELIRRVNESRRRTLSIPRYIRRLRFECFCHEIMKYAEEEPTDLTIESNGRHGIIRMETGQIILDDQHPAAHRRIWKSMMSGADNVWVTPIQKYGDLAIQYTFIFEFQKEIKLL